VFIIAAINSATTTGQAIVFWLNFFICIALFIGHVSIYEMFISGFMFS